MQKRMIKLKELTVVRRRTVPKKHPGCSVITIEQRIQNIGPDWWDGPKPAVSITMPVSCPWKEHQQENALANSKLELNIPPITINVIEVKSLRLQGETNQTRQRLTFRQKRVKPTGEAVTVPAALLPVWWSLETGKTQWVCVCQSEHWPKHRKQYKKHSQPRVNQHTHHSHSCLVALVRKRCIEQSWG